MDHGLLRNGGEDSLNRPEETHRRDRERRRDDDPAAVPGFWAEGQAEEEKGEEDDGQLAELDAGVEAKKSGPEFRARQAELREHARETHPMQQAEREDERHPPRGELRPEHVLDRDVDDRNRDQR